MAHLFVHFAFEEEKKQVMSNMDRMFSVLLFLLLLLSDDGDDDDDVVTLILNIF